MSVEALSTVALAVAAVGVALAVVIVVRLARLNPSSQSQGLELAIARLEQRLRDELVRGRQEAATGSKLLREEVIGAFGSLADTVRKAMSDLSAGQGVQLDGFADRLNETKSEAAANARALREEVRQTLQQLGDRLALARQSGGRCRRQPAGLVHLPGRHPG